MVDAPKLLGNSSAVQERLSQIELPPMAPHTEFVRRLRSEMGSNASIPYFDPWDGGINAEVLYLLEAPGPKAIKSGFISRNNPDETAKNFYEVNQQAGIDRKRTVVWNVVPWYIGSGPHVRPANAKDIEKGTESLAELLQLLPKLRVIVLVGQKAQKALNYAKVLAPSLVILDCPHPSPLFVNRKPGNRQLLLTKLRQVRVVLNENRNPA